MLADFCFSDLVLYLRDPDPVDDTRFVMTDHVRPATSQTIYHDDITGEVAVFESLFAKRNTLRGMRIVEEPPALRHFTAKFAEI